MKTDKKCGDYEERWTCFLDRRSFWNFTSEATINKMCRCRWKSLKLMRSGNFKRFLRLNPHINLKFRERAIWEQTKSF